MKLFRKRSNLLYQNHSNNHYLFLFLALLILFINKGISQEKDAEDISENEQYADTIVTSFWPNVIRSAIIPGYGQMLQEKPGKAVIFYGMAASLVYNGAFNYYWYNKTDNNKYLTRFRTYAILYSQLYIMNILDVAKTQFEGRNLVWKSEMFSDIPMKSPWGAAGRSAMLPGWGQVYNEQYFKAIITFGIVGDFVRKAILNNKRYKDTGESGFLERRTVNTWYAGLAYTLNMVDAFVDAYLYKFDETMDISMSITPIDNIYGFTLTLSF